MLYYRVVFNRNFQSSKYHNAHITFTLLEFYNFNLYITILGDKHRFLSISTKVINFLPNCMFSSVRRLLSFTSDSLSLFFLRIVYCCIAVGMSVESKLPIVEREKSIFFLITGELSETRLHTLKGKLIWIYVALCSVMLHYFAGRYSRSEMITRMSDVWGKKQLN